MPRRRSLYLLLIIVSLASVLFIRLSASRLSNDLTGLADFAAVDDWGEWVPEWMLPSADTLEEEENGNRGSLGDVAGAGDRKEAERIRTVRNRYNATFEQDRSWYAARSLNYPALTRLAQCIEDPRPCGTHETQVVVLGSMHFGLVYAGSTSGESIWAQSTIEALDSLNYTLLYAFGHMDALLLYHSIGSYISHIIWDAVYLDRCIARDSSNYMELEAQEVYAPGDWQTAEAQGDTGGKIGCIKKEGYEEGIPVWKVFAFHYWRGAKSPLGMRWTLAPINYKSFYVNEDNFFLGYSIESKCNLLPYHPFSSRQHRGLVLGKLLSYYTDEWFLFPNMLENVTAAMPAALNEQTGEVERFKLVGGVKAGQDLPGGVENLGTMNRDDFYQLLGRSKVLLGLGRPFLSPSPYDALCFGVPFINPIHSRLENEPENRIHWSTQHDELRMIEPPYVYHVMRGDAGGLEASLRAAIITPIERYTPPSMTREVVRLRHKALLETDWLEEAKLAVDEIYTSKGEKFPLIL